MRAPGSAFARRLSTVASALCTPGLVTVLPAGSVTTGSSGLADGSPPYCLAIETFVSHPSLPGTVNFWSMALLAGPAAAMPATVSTIQATATIRLCARTQRVSDDTFASPIGRSGGRDHAARCARERHQPKCGFAVRPEDDWTEAGELVAEGVNPTLSSADRSPAIGVRAGRTDPGPRVAPWS